MQCLINKNYSRAGEVQIRKTHTQIIIKGNNPTVEKFFKKQHMEQRHNELRRQRGRHRIKYPGQVNKQIQTLIYVLFLCKTCTAMQRYPAYNVLLLHLAVNRCVCTQHYLSRQKHNPINIDAPNFSMCIINCARISLQEDLIRVGNQSK